MAHGNGFDGIDSADTRSTAVERSQRRLTHIHDVRRHFRDYRYRNGIFDKRGVEEDEFFILSNVRPQACQTHLRAGEIEFHSVATGILSHLSQFYPFLFGLTHYGSNNDLGGKILFKTPENVKVLSIRIFAQLLHVAEADKRCTFFAHGVKSRRHFLDILFADGFVEHTAPPCFQSPGYHIVVRADSGRRQEEGVFAYHVAEIDLQRG